MKIRQTLVSTLAALAMSTALSAAPAAPTHTSTDIVFLEPAKFTDVRDSHMGDHERTTYLEQLRDHLREQAARFVPPGHKLAITITDIDMAGDFEPWRGPQFNDIRIVKDIYPPRINLSFQLTDAEGNVVKQGARELRDLAFMMKVTMGFRDDPVRHEKALLDDWLRTEFTRVRKS